MRLDPTVLDQARTAGGFTNDEQLGNAIGFTAATVRAYRAGKSVPNVVALIALRRLTGRPLDTMIVADGDTRAELTA